MNSLKATKYNSRVKYYVPRIIFVIKPSSLVLPLIFSIAFIVVPTISLCVFVKNVKRITARFAILETTKQKRVGLLGICERFRFLCFCACQENSNGVFAPLLKPNNDDTVLWCEVRKNIVDLLGSGPPEEHSKHIQLPDLGANHSAKQVCWCHWENWRRDWWHVVVH